MILKPVKRLISVFMCCVILVASAFYCGLDFPAAAIAFPCKGVIEYSDGRAKIYDQPGTKVGTHIDTIYNGHQVLVLGTGIDPDGDMWYKIKYGDNYSKEGYAFNRRVKLTPEYITDAAFEQHLNEQNFPESYKQSLRLLHTLYPSWVFYADHTNIDFNTAVERQYSEGSKLVATTKPDSWKSILSDSYIFTNEIDPITGEKIEYYKVFDSGAWNKASKKVIAYYIDPRNFLDTTNIYMFFSLSLGSLQTTEAELKKAAQGTFLAGNLPDNPNKSYAQTILEAGNASGVNPFALLGKIRQEQGTAGDSKLISGTDSDYPSIYNYFNVGAFADDGMDTATRGLWWASGSGSGSTSYGRPWNTAEKSILGGSAYFAEGYVEKGQDTFYYQNFNVGPNAKYDHFAHQYATNIEDTVGKTNLSKYSEIFLNSENVAVPIHIPVYLNMPEKTELPPSGTNNNYYLENLQVKGQSVLNFDRYTNSYELVVPFTASTVEIEAITSDAGAKVTGAGARTLAVGVNNIDITVTASSGETNVYKLSIARQGSEGEVPTPTFNTSLNLDKTLTGITPGSNVSAVKAALGVKNGTLKILDAAGNEKAAGSAVATGDAVYAYDLNNKVSKTFKIVIYGDINGDGRITSVDLLVGQRHILGKTILNDVYNSAADIDRNGKINSIDLLVGQRHILGKSTIKQ